MNNQIKLLTIATTLLAFTQAADAANNGWDGQGATDDWNDATNWQNDVIPGASEADQAVFDTGDSNAPTADFSFTVASNVTVRRNVVITIGAGVDISNFDAWRLGANSGLDGGNIVMTGGSLTGGNLAVASSPTASNRSSLTVSGGSLTTSAGFNIGSLGDFNLSGNAATFDVGSFEVKNDSVFNTTFDASGISTVATSGVFTIGATANLNLDLSAFSGTGTFDLVTFDSMTGIYDSGSITGLGALSGGRTASLGYDADSMFVTVAVPEPGTYALLAGLTGLAFVMLRRRA